MAVEKEYKFAPSEFEFQFGDSTRDSVLNEIRRQEPNRLSGLTKVTHVVFVPNWMAERAEALAGQTKVKRSTRRGSPNRAAASQDPAENKTANEMFRLAERLPNANPKYDTYLSDDRCKQFIQYVRPSNDPSSTFRFTLRRTDERDFVSYTFYLEDLEQDEDAKDAAPLALAPTELGLTPFKRERWLSQLFDPQFLSDLARGTGSAALIDPFATTLKNLLPDYNTPQNALEPARQLILGSDYFILPGSLFFEPGLVQATLEKSSTVEADSAVLSALLDRDVTQPGSLTISTESFHRPGFRRFVSTRDGQAAFADLFMRLVKPVLRGAFARLPADNAERSKFAYPFFGSQVMGGAAFLVSDLRPHRPHDFARVLIFDFGLNAFSRGRLLQACTDIGTFRILALQELLAMRSVNDRLANISASFTQTINRYYDNAHRSLKSNVESISTLRAQMNEIVDQLRGLSGVNRDTIHGVLESAARAQEYVAIVDDRVRALGEAVMPGHQTLREFLDRRFKRAVRDIDRAAVRYEMIRRRIDEALGVVRTVLDVREREYQISNQRFSNLLRNIASVGTTLGFVGGALYWIWSPARLAQSISWLPTWMRPFADQYATPEALSLAVVTAGALLLLLMIWYLNRRR